MIIGIGDPGTSETQGWRVLNQRCHFVEVIAKRDGVEHKQKHAHQAHRAPNHFRSPPADEHQLPPVRSPDQRACERQCQPNEIKKYFHRLDCAQCGYEPDVLQGGAPTSVSPNASATPIGRAISFSGCLIPKVSLPEKADWQPRPGKSLFGLDPVAPPVAAEFEFLASECGIQRAPNPF